jgi:hypothetical protein
LKIKSTEGASNFAFEHRTDAKITRPPHRAALLIRVGKIGILPELPLADCMRSNLRMSALGQPRDFGPFSACSMIIPSGQELRPQKIHARKDSLAMSALPSISAKS